MHIFFVCSLLCKRIPSMFLPALMSAMPSWMRMYSRMWLSWPNPLLSWHSLDLSLVISTNVQKACYGLREAGVEEARDKTLTSCLFHIDGEEDNLRQSTYHPSLWFVVKAPCALRPQTVWLPDDSRLSDVSVFGEHQHIAAFLVYVDDFLAAGPQMSFNPSQQIVTCLEGQQPRILEKRAWLGPEEGTWPVHQETHIYAFLQEMFDPECLKNRRTPGEPESFSHKQHAPHAPRACTESTSPASTTPSRTRSTRTYTYSAFSWCVALDFSVRTRPDIAWAVARTARLASADEYRARVCIRRVAQTFEMDLADCCNLLCSMSLSSIVNGIATPTQVGREKVVYSHQFVAIDLGKNLVAWQSQRQSPIALASAEAELTVSVWTNVLH